MPLHFRYAVMTCVLVASGMSAKGQIYKLHNADVAMGGTGQFTTSITDQTNTPHQATTDSAGFLFSFREHPVPWAGIELNYQYSSFSERYTSSFNGAPLASVPLSFHEGTGAYLFHRNYGRVHPFLGIGGGTLYFDSITPLGGQLRGTGLFEVGADAVTHNPHLAFRVQARSLLYRAPNFNDSAIATSRWVATTEPSASVVLRF